MRDEGTTIIDKVEDFRKKTETEGERSRTWYKDGTGVNTRS